MTDQAEIDAERINAAHRVLAGPQKIWLLWWEDIDSPSWGCFVCSTRETTIKRAEKVFQEAFNEWMHSDDDRSETRIRQSMNNALNTLRVSNGMVTFYGCNYWIHERIVDEGDD